MSRVVKFIDTENRMIVARSGSEELLLNGNSVSVWEDEKVLEMDDDNGHTTMLMYLTSLNCMTKSY